MNDELRQLVWNRAAGICEYCRVPQTFDPLPFGIDSIAGRTTTDVPRFNLPERVEFRRLLGVLDELGR